MGYGACLLTSHISISVIKYHTVSAFKAFSFALFISLIDLWCRSHWPRGLRRRSAAVRLLRLWVRIPPGAWMYVGCECCVLSGGGLCDELITRPEESNRLWCAVCDLETSRKEEAMAHWGMLCKNDKKNRLVWFWNCRYDVGARLSKSHHTGRLHSCSLSPKKQFWWPHQEPVTAKSLHYLVVKTHEQIQRYPYRTNQIIYGVVFDGFSTGYRGFH